MKMLLAAPLALALLLLASVPAFALQANLSWTAPVLAPTDPTPTGVLVQKAAVIGGPFTTLHTLGFNAVADIDTTVTLGTQVCYQIVWQYTLGNSAPLGPVCGTPAVGPKGSNLTIIFQP